jgi:hypothetical protein
MVRKNQSASAAVSVTLNESMIVWRGGGQDARLVSPVERDG